MKEKWEEAIFEAASAGKRFDHDDDCQVRYTSNGWKGCKCAAGPANTALNEIVVELKVGIPLSGVK